MRKLSFDEREKGAKFERLIQRWFKTDPRYSSLREVWLWEEFPGRKDFGGSDLGIDLVAKTDQGDFWAIQCKCYDENTVIQKHHIESTISNAYRTFIDGDTLQTKEFSNIIFVDTTRRRWGKNAEETTKGQRIPITRINLYELEQSCVDWEALRKGVFGNEARLGGKQPLEHQLRALAAATDHFVTKGNERGKLIMACGTGKTYTALCMVEKLTPEDGFILFLVPSIALLGQTLNAWMSDKTQPIKAICVCSDNKVNRRAEDDEDGSVVELALPATTNVDTVVKRLNAYTKSGERTVIFSTYQSIDVVSEALLKFGKTVDLVVCDEAHRTTGVKWKNRDESYFTKVHDNTLIPASRRLYMTATPRLYGDAARGRAALNGDLLCSMDDEGLYGKEFFRLSFSDAVANGLLCDYKVLVLTISDEDVPEEMRKKVADDYAAAKTKDEKLSSLQFDDQTKLIGCINGLSKRLRGDQEITKSEDPVLMKRAVAFCPVINPTTAHPKDSSKQVAKYFSTVCEAYKETIDDNERKEVVDVQAKHIDGSMDANERNELLNWLKSEDTSDGECRVLCNVRCLSEGVDVPALDAVLFLSPKNSEVEVVQSVGRVMRSFHKGMTDEKKYGYIIISVIVPPDVKPEDALNDNEKFKVVWQVLNALRSHDENFNATVNKIALNNSKPSKITIAGVPSGQYGLGDQAGDGKPDNDAVQLSNEEVREQLLFKFGELREGIYARLVEKVGDKLYWENWAKDIGKIAQKYIERITLLVKEDEGVKYVFDDFVGGLQKNINPSIKAGEAIEMLAQHMVTQPVFDALFEDYKFVENNSISQAMHNMIEILKLQGFEMEREVLERFYTSVRNNVSGIDNLEGKQTLIKNLYEKFFKGAFPLTVDKLGIVYTPIECVDFIIRSVDDILKSEFNTALTEENVHILDPFTGTGTFITRLLQSGLIRKEDMERKFRKEIHCNEIVLLAYYIADVNIESVYQDIMKPKEYVDFDGICLTDTFQINENDDKALFSEYFADNSKGVIEQKKAPIRVIIGNPPYSVGQKSANDNAQNLSYPILDSRIKNTYVAATSDKGKTVQALYDSYIKAFRWASDRISQNPEGGIVAFISNGAWLDSNAGEGFRKCLQDEFSSIYVLNLRGNQRTSGELSRKEGGKIFGSGSRTPISITILVKNPKKQGKAEIFYHDIGDYLSRDEKLKLVKGFVSITGKQIEWIKIEPNDKYDWINQRDGLFDNFPIIGSKKKTDTALFFNIFSAGDITHRDVWCYDSSSGKLSERIKGTIEFYNTEKNKCIECKTLEDVMKTVSTDETKIKWDQKLYEHALRGIEEKFDSSNIRLASYRPYFKQWLYYDKSFNWSQYQLPKLFPYPTSENKLICWTMGNKSSAIITNNLLDLHYNGDVIAFPLYWYEENKNPQASLFDDELKDKYIRRDGITDWILKNIRQRFSNTRIIDKEMIFYYVYGLLHSPEYRTRFADDLKKSLPRIPIVETIEEFIEFSSAGRKLADLHLNYENVTPAPEVVVKDIIPEGEDLYEHYRVHDKMRYRSKGDKSTILYNGHITIENIPAKAYEYIVNGKSAIDWIMERYCVSQDKASLIVNDANDWGKEHGKPRYILDLLLSVINVSCQTVDIVNALPKLKFE